MIKCFGIIILATRFELGDRDSLWSTVSQLNYRSAPAFVETIINTRRFDMLWRHVSWRHHPDVQDGGIIHEAHQWKLVEDFFTHFNKYHTELFSTFNITCAEESISR